MNRDNISLIKENIIFIERSSREFCVKNTYRVRTSFENKWDRTIYKYIFDAHSTITKCVR